jgi:hypothetical protein
MVGPDASIFESISLAAASIRADVGTLKLCPQREHRHGGFQTAVPEASRDEGGVSGMPAAGGRKRHTVLLFFPFLPVQATGPPARAAGLPL